MNDVQKMLVKAYAESHSGKDTARFALNLMGLDAEMLEDFNPYHDKSGKFASKGGASGGGAQWHTSGKKIQVPGPKASRKFISNYLKKNPDVAKDAKKYSHVLSMVRDFQKNNPDAEDGTYSATTGKKVEDIPGFCVTFHQNNTEDDPFGGYTDDDYGAMCAIAKKELGCDDVYIGYFGNPEVSFSCTDKQKAMDFAIEHNQHSIFDPETFKVIKNPYYSKKKNPIKGH